MATLTAVKTRPKTRTTLRVEALNSLSSAVDGMGTGRNEWSFEQADELLWAAALKIKEIHWDALNEPNKEFAQAIRDTAEWLRRRYNRAAGFCNS